MTMKLGQPKYERVTKNYFAFKKDQNSFVLRILPPMGDLAESGKWSIYHRVEFGYTTSDGKLRPFLSPRVVNRDGMVEIESEAHKRRETLKLQNEQAKKAGNKVLEEKTKTLLAKYNQDAKHYMNVVDLQGNVGLFKIGHRGFQALKAESDRLRSEGVDPIGIENGRFFVFSRSGKGRDTIYTVSEYKQKVTIEQNGQSFVVDKPFPHSINETIISKLATDAFELDKIYPEVTPEQEYRIVHEGTTAVDEILGSNKKEESKNPASTAQQTAPVQEKAAAPAPAPEQADEDSEQTYTDETYMQQLQPVPEEKAAAPTAGVTDMSEEDFFKMIESGKM